jgi:hypothetical protein
MLIRLIKSKQVTPVKQKDVTITQREITWNGEAPQVVECDGEMYRYSYTSHLDNEVWQIYRPATFIDLTSTPIIPWETPKNDE